LCLWLARLASTTVDDAPRLDAGAAILTGPIGLGVGFLIVIKMHNAAGLYS
jgi:hypothetical protein